MPWIKQNLFFVIGGTLALLLLGGASFYNYQGWNHNNSAFTQLNEIYGNLQQLNSQKPSPGDARINNTQTAKDQEAAVVAWVQKARGYFKPIEAIPNSPEVTSEAYAAALRRTVDQLQREAEAASVQLPPQSGSALKYGFGFDAQRSIVRFAPGSLAPLAVQLGEVKAIAEIIYAARVNALEAIQRVRVSEDDAAGSAADYIADIAVTNELAILTPYRVTFRSFTPELAAVLAGFAASPDGFIVKGINVSPAGATAGAMVPAGGPEAMFMARGDVPGFPSASGSLPPGAAPGAGRGGPTTFLKEQLLRVTLEVVIVKPLAKK